MCVVIPYNLKYYIFIVGRMVGRWSFYRFPIVYSVIVLLGSSLYRGNCFDLMVLVNPIGLHQGAEWYTNHLYLNVKYETEISNITLPTAPSSCCVPSCASSGNYYWVLPVHNLCRWLLGYRYMV